jgi:hypothetical protein
MPNAVRAIVGTRDVMIVAPESSFNIPIDIRHSTFESTFDIPIGIPHSSRHSTFGIRKFGIRPSAI